MLCPCVRQRAVMPCLEAQPNDRCSHNFVVPGQYSCSMQSVVICQGSSSMGLVLRRLRTAWRACRNSEGCPGSRACLPMKCILRLPFTTPPQPLFHPPGRSSRSCRRRKCSSAGADISRFCLGIEALLWLEALLWQIFLRFMMSGMHRH